MDSGDRSAFGESMVPLIQYWHEASPPSQVAETLRSFVNRNPELNQLVFDEDSAESFIASHYGARAAAAFRSCRIPAMQADYFRYCAVHALGGIYADANYQCLGALGWMLDEAQEGVVFGREDPVPVWLARAYNWPYPVGRFRAITNGLFGFRVREHPLLGLAVQAATANIERRVGEGPVGVWLGAGPGVLTSIYLLHQLGSFDAFIEYSVGSVIESSAPLLCEIVGDYARIPPIWDGVEVRSLNQVKNWATKDDTRPRKENWIRVEGSIYR